MNNKALWLLLGVAAVLYLTANTNTGEDIVNTVISGAWLQLGNAPMYVPYINQVEAQYGLPQNLLARVAYQESHFDPTAVNASSGAVGMFQLMPQFYPGAGQNWQTDAATAAGALAGYYKTYSDWQLAIAAYNDGPGNVNSYLAGTRALPAETTNYVAAVFTDVPIAGSLFDVTSGQLTV
jgi:membrane-bound lytic murein transglycosylase D